MKKITKNNKGFSLIELIIVIAIMAVLVAIIAPNLTKYLGSSKKNTDKKNADEIASTIQTCISDFETSENSTGDDHGYLGKVEMKWDNTGLQITTGTHTDIADFKAIVDSAVKASVKSKEVSKDNGTSEYAYAHVAIDPKDSGDLSKGYDITVELGKLTGSNAIKK